MLNRELIKVLAGFDPESEALIEMWSDTADRYVLVDIVGVVENPTSPTGYYVVGDNPIEEPADYGFHHNVSQGRNARAER